MNQSKGSSNKTGGRQSEMPLDSRKDEGGHSGGQRAPRRGEKAKSRQKGGQGSQADMEREKADKGKGSPA